MLHPIHHLSLLCSFQPPERQIVVGICCMMKKSKSKPMTQILERLCKFEYITVVIFPEDVILNEPVEKWPLCDCLISFHSKGDCFCVMSDQPDLLKPSFLVSSFDLPSVCKRYRQCRLIIISMKLNLKRFCQSDINQTQTPPPTLLFI